MQASSAKVTFTCDLLYSPVIIISAIKGTEGDPTMQSVYPFEKGHFGNPPPYSCIKSKLFTTSWFLFGSVRIIQLNLERYVSQSDKSV